MGNNMKNLTLSVVVALAGMAATNANAAATIVKDNSSVINIPGLTGFQTNGAQMTGLSVTATFGPTTEQRSWATTGAASGGVSGSGWGLSLTGDSFTSLWQFTIDPNAGLGQLTSLVLNGLNVFTVFDTTEPNDGTLDSAQGADFDFAYGGGTDYTATVTYSNVVAVIPDSFVGDLYQTVTVNFGQGGPRSNWSFRQDTDNDSRLVTGVPEPGSLLLLGLGLAALGASRRRSA